MRKFSAFLIATVLCFSMLCGCASDRSKEPVDIGPQAGPSVTLEGEIVTTTEATTTEATTTTPEGTTTEATTTASEDTTVSDVDAGETSADSTDTEASTTTTEEVTNTEETTVSEDTGGTSTAPTSETTEVTTTTAEETTTEATTTATEESTTGGASGEPTEVTTTATTATEADPKGTPDGKTLIEEMGVGWNLGNTLDCEDAWKSRDDVTGFETAWGHPVTTKAMIDKIRELGFDTIRIPVSWGQKTDNSYNISNAWMDRVQTVVDYAIDNGMYVIINSHHDNDYYYPSTSHERESKAFIQNIWTQIAERFKDYDYHLIFESMNEPRLADTQYEWWYDENSKECREAARIINEMNQIFVDVVRQSGGNNLDRYLAVTCYDASPNNYIQNDSFILPTDSVKDRLIISAHAYTPYNLVMGNDMKYVTFGSSQKNDINWFMKGLYDRFVKNGIPVYIGETGCINKNNPDARHDWAYYFFKTANKYGMTAIVWENSSDTTGTESYALFNRRTLKIFDNSLPVYNGIMEAKAEFKY